MLSGALGHISYLVMTE